VAIGDGFERSALLEDTDAGVLEEAVVIAAAFPRRAAALAPRLWKLIERVPAAAPRALFALTVLEQPRVHDAALVLADQLDPRDDAGALYLAAVEVFSGQGAVSRNSRARLAKRLPGTVLQTSCPFASTLGELVKRTTEKLYPPKP
jgi:hypothetical protein